MHPPATTSIPDSPPAAATAATRRWILWLALAKAVVLGGLYLAASGGLHRPAAPPRCTSCNP